MKALALVAVAATLLVACGGGGPSLTAADIDQNMRISRENAELNAKGWARNNVPGFERVVFDSDSTIDASCPFGDGWASGEVIDSKGKAVPIKCQTNGNGKGDNGCMLKADFMGKEKYAAQEGKCDASLQIEGQSVMGKLGG